MSSVIAIHRDGVPLELESKQVDALKAALRGTLLRSGDDGYADARSIWNAMIDRRPRSSRAASASPTSCRASSSLERPGSRSP